MLTVMCYYSPVQAEDFSETPEEKSTMHILFIGNSSTYYNSMPEIVEGLANAGGISTEVSSITAGNYKLTQFADETNAYHKQIVETLKKEKFSKFFWNSEYNLSVRAIISRAHNIFNTL